jgi:hypothetical protein
MDNRIIMLVMALTTFIAYPFLSGDDRKQVAPLANHIDEPVDEDEIEDDDEVVMMEDDDDLQLAELQLKKESENMKSSITDPQIKNESQHINNPVSDPQMKDELDDEILD